ncbi:DUF3644 domain-containing protein [Acinetobacter faecalis]|uniref:DUF3644 domain-containing protein n=1 Tax=Acinetobacter faecalis TaxID=2665161 RepID=A0AB35UWX2_9GAMM|nr:DUF3644 domain-containing protein [Acinetobacter faecalis]MDY6485630.1 DUF3644 domain-containing protein [Acinetobacter faecalis]
MKAPILRKGKTKSLLESSIDCALLAVEIYNKPRAPFRVETFVTHMIMAWTRLFQAHFNFTIGETYFYKEKNGRYKLVDGEKKAWELKACISEYGKLSQPVKTNLDFFIKLRNKIEHRTIDKDEIGLSIFGECQSLLYNYENELIKLFGEDYAINESLAYSLQFSKIRTTQQKEASKQLLSNEYRDLMEFIKKYREHLRDDIFQSQEYSIKLIQIPKIANTSKNDLAVEFVNWNVLSEEDKEKYEKLNAIVKDKVIKREAINIGKLKPNLVLESVKNISGTKLSHNDHKQLLCIFKVRPYPDFSPDADVFDTNTKYCHYDEAHKDYLYQDEWINFLVKLIQEKSLAKELWKQHFKSRITLNICDYE